MTVPKTTLLEPDLARLPRDRRDRHEALLRAIGEGVLTLGVVIMLFTGYEVVVTGWESAAAQSRAAADLDRQWGSSTGAKPVAGTVPVASAVGEPELRMYVPALGEDWTRTVLEGVGQDVLAAGPGHYPGTALPGALGNVAIAGHRVGHGAPFDAAGELQSCDAIVLEDRTTWFVYRLLPLSGEQNGWAKTSAARPRCRGVGPLSGVYANLPGREIVVPTSTQVIAPVPDQPGVAATRQLMTITTCNPRFSARQRLVLHAGLTVAYAKADHPGGWRPPDLAEG